MKYRRRVKNEEEEGTTNENISMSAICPHHMHFLSVFWAKKKPKTVVSSLYS